MENKAVSKLLLHAVSQSHLFVIQRAFAGVRVTVVGHASSSSSYSGAEAAGGGHGARAAASLLAVDQRVELGGTAGGPPGQGHVAVGHAGEVAGDRGVFQTSAQQDAVPLELLGEDGVQEGVCLLYTSPSPRDLFISRMPSSA